MMNTAVIGLQFGDEGKGKVVDFLAQKHDIVARFSGGSNAGHTVIYNGEKIKFHLIPSGVLSGKIGVLGNGMAIDLKKLRGELQLLQEYGISGKVLISSRAHVVTPLHRALDAKDDEILKIGTTRQGIGPAYCTKVRRTGLRMYELFSESTVLRKLKQIVNLYDMDTTDSELKDISTELNALAREFKENITDTELWLNKAINSGNSVLFEGSQGAFLDMDFGTYPYVTSSSTTTGGILTGLGVPASKIDRVVGVAKAYTTRVGEGPFPTELFGEKAEELRKRGNEFGATTGRPRRVGYLDLVLLRYSVMISGVTDIILTKADVLAGYSKIPVAVSYDCNGKKSEYPGPELAGCNPVYTELNGWDSLKNSEFEEFVKFIEKETGTKISYVSYGPKRDEMIKR